jgi:hypothetical protein
MAVKDFRKNLAPIDVIRFETSNAHRLNFLTTCESILYCIGYFFLVKITGCNPFRARLEAPFFLSILGIIQFPKIMKYILQSIWFQVIRIYDGFRN